jgi:hypothetical protein
VDDAFAVELAIGVVGTGAMSPVGRLLPDEFTAGVAMGVEELVEPVSKYQTPPKRIISIATIQTSVDVFIQTSYHIRTK